MNKTNKYFIFGSVFGIGLGLAFRHYYYYYCMKKTFDRLDNLFPRNLEWEKDLSIYSVALPRFYTSSKKKKCVLFISGYRDIPYLWEELCEYFKINSIDYYAPRTHGKGRSFFQETNPKEWIITYLEALKILEEQYEHVDIIGFSTGAVIALYLTQFKYKCKITNLILCAPFLLLNSNDHIMYWTFESPISYIIQGIIKLIGPLRYKITFGKQNPRDIHYTPSAEKDFYELAGNFWLDCELMEFKKFRPKQILVDNIAILYPNDDKVIGDIFEQKKIIEEIWNQSIPIITIPNFSNFQIKDNIEEKQIIKCAHVMFKEHPLIVQNIFENIYQFIV